MGFSKQEYWSGLPCPSPGDLPDPGVPLPFLWKAPPLEMRRECQEFFLDKRRERILPLDLGGGYGAPLDVGGTLVFPLEWRRVCRGTS